MKKRILTIITIIKVTTVIAQNLDRTQVPLATIPSSIQLGEINSFKLANGLKVVVVENHKIPTVAYSLILEIYPQLEGSAAGLADITSELLTCGTTHRTKDELDNEIDFIGAKLKTSAKGFNASALKKENEKLLAILSDITLNSNFDQKELDKLKNLKRSALEKQKDDPDAISKNVQAVLNFGKNHPYGEITTEQSVNQITLEQCINYYQNYFRPNVAYLGIVGDVTVEEIKPLIEQYFGGWQQSDVPSMIPSMPTAPSMNKLVLINKPEAVQSVIDITYPITLKPNSEDLIKVKVLNTILGGATSSRLSSNLREKNGYTYSCYSSLNSDELTGQFSVYTKVRSSATDSAINEILGELKRIKTEKVDATELARVKNYLTGSFAISLEDPATIAKFAINIDRYKLPPDYYINYLTNLAAVTADDVYAMAQKYIYPDKANIIVIVNKENVSASLLQFNSKNTIEYYDIYGNSLASKLKPVPPNISTKTVINAYLKAIGGARKIKRIKDSKIVRTADSQYGKITMTEQKKNSIKYLMQVEVGGVTIQKTVFDGEKAIQDGMQGKRDVVGDELAELKTEAIIYKEKDFEKFGYQLNLKGIEPIFGKDAYVIEVTNPLGKISTDWYDVETGYKVRSVSTTKTEQSTFTQTIDYLDYKAVKDILYPNVILINGGPFPLRLTLQSIDINKKMPDTEFKIN